MANEKRLIDANALWFVFGEEAEKLEGVKDERKRVAVKLVMHWCMEKLAVAPTVDAVEVVRCKDCKYRAKSIVRDCYYCKNPHHGLTAVAKLKDYDFCPYGERRNDG